MADSINHTAWRKLVDPEKSVVWTTKNNEYCKDWPSLNDSKPSSSALKKDQTKLRSDLSDTAAGADNSSSKKDKTGARKKEKGETVWSTLPMPTMSYRKNRNNRQSNNDSSKFHVNGRQNSSYFADSIASGSTDNHDRPPFRGGRCNEGNSPLRSHLEESSNAVESTKYPEETLKKVRCQIEYYFCEKNLLKDRYLRSQMDDQGYVQLSEIAKFPRIAQTTDDMQLILTAVKNSSHLQVSEDVKIRPVVEPLRWRLKQTTSEYNQVFQGQHNMQFQHLLYPIFPQLVHQFLHDTGPYLPQCLYPQVDLNSVTVENSLNIPPNKHGCASYQEDPSKQFCDVNSQFVRNNSHVNLPVLYCNKNPAYYESNRINGTTNSINHAHAYTSDPMSSYLSGGFTYQNLPGYYSKTPTTLCSVNEIQPYGESSSNHSTFGANITNEQFRYEDGVRNFKFGQNNNGVLVYNCNSGHYYMAASDEILANSPDICEEESSLHNKSPEPTR